ncbi:MAG TPA: hypothetical protein VFP91_19575 [Vicinamibacterales bacterium]|nr:hypothetical protein [Vicinamibacterales bacterium]
MLHITNGDSVINGFNEGRIPGTYLAWKDVLHDGPMPRRNSLEAESDVRAAYHAGQSSGPEYEKCRTGFSERDQALASFADYDEVVLWFEHDLYDQLQLLQILAWLSRHEGARDRVSLIQIGEHPDVPKFQGLGQLNGAQLAALLPTRRPVTARQVDIARNAWAAFCDDDPTTLCQVARRHEPEMPFLSSALTRLLEEYPWASDGLTRTERQLLRVIAAGTTKRKAIWWASQQFETSYWGDLSVYDRLDTLAVRPHALVKQVDNDHVALTDTGRRVLAGDDRCDPRETERWLGGVQLGPGLPDWRWDEAAQTVTVSLAG